MKAFDRKFGAEFVSALPTAPAVYRVYDAGGALIYVGKAKNLRRRLGQYRNAKRRKKHFKMRQVVADAARIEFDPCPSDLEACLLEARLIQEHRPRWNTAGAFFFLYPLLGLKFEAGIMRFCYTTQPESFPGFEFHGAYRSRGITAGAFWAMMELLSFVGHRMRRSSKDAGIPKYSYVVGFRQLPEPWLARMRDFFKGESKEAMELLVLALVENAGARRKGREIQESLNRLKLFWRHEACSLKKVREATGYGTYPVPQRERDFLYLKRRYAGAVGAAIAKACPPGTQGPGDPSNDSRDHQAADRVQDGAGRAGRPGRSFVERGV